MTVAWRAAPKAQPSERALRAAPFTALQLTYWRAARATYGLLHESYAHERLKSSFAFRKPAMAVVSRHPARTEGL